MRARGVRDARVADVFTFAGGPYQTALMLGHGVGMVEHLAGLDRFLGRLATFMAPDGHVLLNTLDVRDTDDPRHLAYQDINRRAGRYLGEIRQQVVFEGVAGPYFGWLHVDAETLAARAEVAGWNCEVGARGDGGEFLARLFRVPTDS